MSEYGGRVSKLQIRHQGERACAQLIGIIAGITADGQLNDLEIQFLRTWFSQNRQASEHWLGSQLVAQIDAVMANGGITDDERAALLANLQAASGIQFSDTGSVTAETVAIPSADCEVVFPGRVFCLTGKFAFGPRGDCERVTMAAGATVVYNVHRKVDYLVIGSAGATSSWKQASYGEKIDSAMQLRERGHPIFVLAEDAWRKALPT